MDSCLSFGKSGHIRRDCPTLKVQVRENKESQASASNSDAPKKNLFYALEPWSDQEGSPNVDIDTLQIFSIHVYELLDLSATLYFVTLLVSIKFNLLLHILKEPFLVSTSIGDSVVEKRVYKKLYYFFIS